jgi:hypothetical protein
MVLFELSTFAGSDFKEDPIAGNPYRKAQPPHTQLHNFYELM